jgi:hypothetical protein
MEDVETQPFRPVARRDAGGPLAIVLCRYAVSRSPAVMYPSSATPHIAGCICHEQPDCHGRVRETTMPAAQRPMPMQAVHIHGAMTMAGCVPWPLNLSDGGEGKRDCSSPARGQPDPERHWPRPIARLPTTRPTGGEWDCMSAFGDPIDPGAKLPYP